MYKHAGQALALYELYISLNLLIELFTVSLPTGSHLNYHVRTETEDHSCLLRCFQLFIKELAAEESKQTRCRWTLYHASVFYCEGFGITCCKTVTISLTHTHIITLCQHPSHFSVFLSFSHCLAFLLLKDPVHCNCIYLNTKLSPSLH